MAFKFLTMRMAWQGYGVPYPQAKSQIYIFDHGRTVCSRTMVNIVYISFGYLIVYNDIVILSYYNNGNLKMSNIWISHD